MRHDEKIRGEPVLPDLFGFCIFFNPKIESNWKYLGNSGDLGVVYIAHENNWPECLYILKLQGRGILYILKITRSSRFYCLQKT